MKTLVKLAIVVVGFGLLIVALGYLAPVLIPTLIALWVLAWKRPARVARVINHRAFARVPRSVRATPMRFATVAAAVLIPLSALGAASVYGDDGSAPPAPSRPGAAANAPRATATSTASPSAPTERPPAPSPTATSDPTATGEPRAADLAPSPPRVAATVVEVVDGDTLKVLLDGQEQTIRIIGVDTPETRDPNAPVMCYGAEATAKTRELVDLAGGKVELERDVSEMDRYGRLLRYVWLKHPDGDRMLNFELVRAGYAQMSTFPPDVKYEGMFRDAQRQARDEQQGLWQACGEFGVPAATATPVPAPPPPPPPTATPASSTTGGGSAPPSGGSCPSGYPIKGNRSSSGEWIYHVPGGQFYDRTDPEECFATAADAEAAGYRRSRR